MAISPLWCIITTTLALQHSAWDRKRLSHHYYMRWGRESAQKHWWACHCRGTLQTPATLSIAIPQTHHLQSLQCNITVILLLRHHRSQNHQEHMVTLFHHAIGLRAVCCTVCRWLLDGALWYTPLSDHYVKWWKHHVSGSIPKPRHQLRQGLPYYRLLDPPPTWWHGLAWQRCKHCHFESFWKGPSDLQRPPHWNPHR